MRLFIATLAACLFTAALMAQTEDPHVTGNVPINFYCRVVDNDGEPIVNATVHLEIHAGRINPSSKQVIRKKPHTLETDSNGNFALATGVITNGGLNIGVSWQNNELSYKPDSPYYSDGTNCFLPLGCGVIRTVTDSREKMAFAARPRSQAVGAVTGAHGVISTEVNLTTSFGFQGAETQHSAEFNWNIQQLGGANGFYPALLDSLTQP